MIYGHNTASKLRPVQMEVLGRTVDYLTDPKHRIVMVEAPTGVGKSLIAVGLATELKSPFTVINTATISLQEQYERDFPSVAILKGKNNFRCGLAEWLTPAEAPCTLDGTAKCDSAYYEQEAKFLDARVAVTNYALFFSELLRGRRWIDRYPQLLVCDEGHRLLDFMTEAEAVTLDIREADALGFKARPLFKLSDAVAWSREHLKEIETRTYGHIMSRSPSAGRYTRLLRQVQNMSEATGELIPTMTGDIFKAVPLWPTKAADGLRSGASKIVIMSATLWGGTFLSKLLHLPEYEYIGLGAQFPSERWPVYFRPVAKMNKGASKEEWTAMSTACHDIMHGTEEKGVIHVASYKQVDQVGREIKRCHSCRPRLTIPRIGESRAETIGAYRAGAGAWIIHPSIGEGESFDDDQCRVQIIAKLRFPDLSDPIVKRRAADKGLGSSYYFHSTAAYTAQTVGRGMRHAEDYCTNYILDGSFASLYDRNKRAFPEWFRQQLR